MTLLGIDIGTTALKAAIFDGEGRQLALVREPYRTPHQDAHVWWRACVRAVRHLAERHRLEVGALEGIGLCGRGGTRVYLDAAGQALTPPAGPASSAAATARAVELTGSRRGGQGIRFLAALIEMRTDHPGEFAHVRRAMFAKDYVILQLTGHAVTDPVSSLDRGDWPEAVLAAPELAGIELSILRRQWEIAGHLRPAVADELGLRHGLPVATGAHDGAAATVGAGAARPGAHAVTLGTNTVYRVIHDDDKAESNRFWSPLPGLVAFGADVTLGGYALDWLAALVGATHEGLTEEALAVPPGCDGVVFLPQFGGRVLPAHSEGLPAGAFVGLRRGADRAHLYRAVLEGNAFALRAARDALLAQGLPEGDIYLTGGGTASALWRQVLADVFYRPVRWSGVEDGCRGAAVFAAVAAGVHPDIAAAVSSMTGAAFHCDPDRDLLLYADAYARFQRVREALDVI